MEKNRIHPQPYGDRVRMSFAREKEVLQMPNLLDVQKDSYRWFISEGLKEVFEDINPITDFGGNLSLEFIDFNLNSEPKYTIQESKERDATYSAPLKVTVRLTNEETILCCSIIYFSLSENGRGKMSDVDCIGKCLCFKAEGVVHTVYNAVFA